MSDSIARRWFCLGSAMIRRCHDALGIKGNMLLFPISKAVTRERPRRCRRTRMEDWANSSGRRKRLPSKFFARLSYRL